MYRLSYNINLMPWRVTISRCSVLTGTRIYGTPTRSFCQNRRIMYEYTYEEPIAGTSDYGIASSFPIIFPVQVKRTNQRAAGSDFRLRNGVVAVTEAGAITVWPASSQLMLVSALALSTEASTAKLSWPCCTVSEIRTQLHRQA